MITEKQLYQLEKKSKHKRHFDLNKKLNSLNKIDLEYEKILSFNDENIDVKPN